MAYQNKVIEIFDNYIASIDESVRDKAEKFFTRITRLLILNQRSLNTSQALQVRRIMRI